MPCGGDPIEKCGNGGILSVYKYNPNKVGGTTPSSSSSSVPSTPTTTSTTSVSTSTTQSQTISLPTPGTVTISASISAHSPTTTTTSASTSSSSTSTQGPDSSRTSSSSAPSTTASNTPPVTGTAPRGWVYRGCYEDKLNPRTLNGSGMYYKVPMTPQACTDHCAQRGFIIAGTEYSGPARLTVYTRDMRQLKRDDEVDVLARDDDMDLVQRNTSDTGSSIQRSKRHTFGAARSHHQRRSGPGRNRLSHANGLF
ncbi:17607_t:CDS:2 [Acaulospora colombiana]|uniref:17607_t:CDS:1 n=1 Tax=Acaulospora colombiana TaxID=27376 RepID=A0ACA9NB26_9GLOM|nr:17607_t:CDS:2 [Acaulospora colombiana]